ncbi:MAG: glycosyltransferase family 4 protein [Deltaproteobacteria bacterium]|nr:glycosyltransferase family 4 protein [Deltaproteobacteria bacterium]
MNSFGVMFDGRYLGPNPSGTGRYCAEVLARMQQQAPDLRFRFVVKHGGDERPLDRDGVLPFDHEVYGPWTSLVLGRKLGGRPADVYHSPFHVLPRGLECATVLTMHDLFHFHQPSNTSKSILVSGVEWAYFLVAIPESLSRADRIVCVSEATADALVDRFPKTKRKLRVIHHGVSKPFGRESDRERVAATCRRIVGDRPFFLCVGGMSPNKNHARTLESYARAVGDRRDAPALVVVSRRGNAARLALRAEELGVAERYVSIQTVSDDELAMLYNGATGLLFVSRAEGFGLPALEALACGCPVITSNVSAMPEVVGDAALLADPLDLEDVAKQIRALAFDPHLAADLSAKGLERARKFSWERSASEHLEVYREALEAR